VSGNGVRTDSFSRLNVTRNRGSNLKILTVIRGLRLNTTIGTVLSVGVSSTIENDYSIKTMVTTDSYNKVEFACVTVLVFLSVASGVSALNKEIYFYNTSFISYSLGLKNVNLKNSAYLRQNVMFFGFSKIELSIV
jgi:hypothetical protein